MKERNCSLCFFIVAKMADGGVDIDLYADDIESDFNRQDEFGGGDNVDLYDDVISAPNVKIEDGEGPPSGQQHSHSSEETNGNSGYHNGPHHGHHGGRRVQLYVGNLTWWATDQDIANAVADIGVNDFQDVRFFENRTNGQSKGFCVITLGSEHSLRIVMERLPKKELHGQHPVVTLPTKQALNQFESQSKTRATPPGPNQGMMRGPHPQGPPGPHPDFYNGPNGPGPNGPPGRMMMPPGGPHHGMRGPPPGGPPHHMQHPGGPGGPPHHMQHPGPPPGHQGPPPGHQGPPHRPPPQFGGGMQQRPMGPGMGRGGGDWGPRPPHMQQPGPPQYHPPPPHHHMPPQHPQHPQHQQHPQHPQHPQHQQHPQHHPGGGMPPPHHGMPPHAQGPPRAPHPGMNNGYPGPGGPPGGPPAPAPHVNPAFFSQQPPVQPQPQPQQQPPPGPGVGYGHGPPPAQALPQAARPQPYGRPPQGYGVVEAGAAVGLGPGGAVPVGGPPRPAPPHVPVVSEAEFEEVMGRNRTVSSSAIARAVSDAAAGEYASAIETLVTAISLIKQSKVAHDDRCKILISSLQDTLHGVESKSYSAGGRRERGTERSDRSRSRERERERERHRRAEPRRRERSASRYRERSRERERDREDRDRYYRDYRERERTRSRERERATDHYPRGHSREERPRKSPVEPVAEAGGGDAPTSKSRSAPYYDERYRERRERETTATDRDREREHRREARH